MKALVLKIKQLFQEDPRQLVFYAIALVLAICVVWFIVSASSFLASSLETMFGAVPAATPGKVTFDIAGFEQLHLNQ